MSKSKSDVGDGLIPDSPDTIRHARIELPDSDFKRLKQAASRYRMSVAAYIRMAVLERVERDEK